jgi:hypothetical protein
MLRERYAGSISLLNCDIDVSYFEAQRLQDSLLATVYMDRVFC